MSLPPGSPLYNKLCNPTNAPLPSSTLSPGTGVAQYDATTFTAPFCQGKNSVCDSGSLLNGRSASETNSPNTIDDCSDGTDETTDFTESVKHISVSSVDNSELRGGSLVKIEATVVVHDKGNRVDFYFAADANNPDWKLITIVAPEVSVDSGSVVTVPYNTDDDPLSSAITYTLPQCTSESGCKQAVR